MQTNLHIGLETDKTSSAVTRHDVPSDQPSLDSLETKAAHTLRARASGKEPCRGYGVNSQCSKVMMVLTITGLEGEGAP